MEDRLRINSSLNLLAVTLSWAQMSLLFVIFCSACLNPSHQVQIDINRYGEMNTEIGIVLIIWLLTTWNMAMTWKRML